jgi:EAL domain-containing protein (putative c-di-GMP-specific phosphodiesterase class I)
VAATILATLMETGLDPQRLEVEITEGVLFENCGREACSRRRTVTAANQVRQHGR